MVFNTQLPSGMVRQPYLNAVLTPGRPATPVRKALKPLPKTNTCFRCLSTDHFVRDCRDPVRCRRCHRSGHRQPDCPMQLASLLSLGRRWSPTVPVPATRRSVHAVPFEQRRTNAPVPEPSSPPPPSPDHTSMNRASLVAYSTRYMVASSSTEAPDFEGPPPCPPVRCLRPEPSTRPHDKFTLGGPGKEVRDGPPSPTPRDNPSRSPPPSPSPPRIPAGLVGMGLPGLPPAGLRLNNVGIDAFDDDSDYEEVESDAFDGSSSSEFSWEGCAHMVQAWLPPGKV